MGPAQWEPKLWHHFYLAGSTESICFGSSIGTKHWGRLGVGLCAALCRPIKQLGVACGDQLRVSSCLPPRVRQSFHSWVHSLIRFTLKRGCPSGLWSLRLLSSSRNFLLFRLESLGTEFPEKLSCVKFSSIFSLAPFSLLTTTSKINGLHGKLFKYGVKGCRFRFCV